MAKNTKTETFCVAVNFGFFNSPNVVSIFVLAFTIAPSFIIQTLFVQFDVIVLEFIGDPLRFTDKFKFPSVTKISDCEKST